jgi:hypothetical protein
VRKRGSCCYNLLYLLGSIRQLQMQVWFKETLGRFDPAEMELTACRPRMDCPCIRPIAPADGLIKPSLGLREAQRQRVSHHIAHQ